MNTKKLLKTINDILLLEDKNNLQANLNSILNFYTQNQPEQLNETKEKIYSIIKDSILFNYVNSDFKILKTIEVYGYFDFSLKEKIELILSSQSHEVQQKMTSFVNKRAELLKKLRALKSALDGLSVNADIINDEAYYVIFSFPNKYHNLDELQRELKM